MLKAFKGFPHSEDAYIYAAQVTKGHIPACNDIVMACQRFIDDFSRDFEFEYSSAAADKAVRFIEKLPHTKGRWASGDQTLVLEPWQKFIVCNIFGWVNKNNFRRFRKVYAKIPRKNGKSPLAAAIGHYMFTMDNEFGAEVYSIATTEKQAWEVFGPARLMADRTPDYRDKFGVEVNAKNMNIVDNGSKYEPLVGKPGDGHSPSCAIIDEFHEHDTDDAYETMSTGMGAREQPLLLVITTAGDNIAGPCYDMEIECQKLLKRVFEDERIFCVMYGLDEEDDWTLPESLVKANPNYDVSVSGEFLQAQQKEAIRNASKQNSFKRKHMDMWVGAHTAWLNMETVNKCIDLTMTPAEMVECELIIPVDLASRIDIVATPKVFSQEILGKKHYYFFSRFYSPEETVLDPKNTHYQRWVNEGYLIATDGNEIDFNEIQLDIKNDMDEFGAKEITYDPWRATQLAQGLQAEGAEIIEFRNTVQNMSPAMYELEAAITAKRFHYDGNPVMNWMLSNVIAKIDAKDNIYPRKQKPEHKIDGAVALIMAIGRFMAHAEDSQPMPGIEVI